jgi:hypothetical protein
MRFVVNGRAISERRVEPAAVVVLEVATQGPPQSHVRVEHDAVEELCFERVEEGFHVRVLAGTVERCALLDAQLPQAIPEERPRVLSPAIAVEDESRADAATADRGIEDGARELTTAPPRERPREDAARVLVHHDREEPPVASDADVGNVANPDAIGASYGQAAHAIRVLAEELVQLRIAAVDARGTCPEADQSHQAHDPTATRGYSLGAQRTDHARTPIRSAVRAKHPLDEWQ